MKKKICVNPYRYCYFDLKRARIRDAAFKNLGLTCMKSNFPQGINEVVLYCIESVWNMLWLVLYVFFQSVGETGLNVSSASNMGRKLLGLVCFWWRT